MIKEGGVVAETARVKSISADLTLSNLVATRTSKGGGGFFNRMYNLHAQNPSFHRIKVIYFNILGTELQEMQSGKAVTKKVSAERLVDKHGLSELEAVWLIDSLCFEKVNLDDLDLDIQTQISDYAPVMSAPAPAEDLLIQYVSILSKNKGCTTLEM